MNNTDLLNILARGVLQLVGLTPEQIQQQTNQRTLQAQPQRKAPFVPKGQLPPKGQPTPAAGPDIPPRSNPFAADPFRERSPQGVRGINQNLNRLMAKNRTSFRPINKRTAVAEVLLNFIGQKIGDSLDEPFQDFIARSIGADMGEYEIVKKGKKAGKTREQIISEIETYRQSPERYGYTGMEDASGDPSPPTKPTPKEQLRPYIAPDAPFSAPKTAPNPNRAPVGSAPQQRSILPPNRPNPWYP